MDINISGNDKNADWLLPLKTPEAKVLREAEVIVKAALLPMVRQNQPVYNEAPREFLEERANFWLGDHSLFEHQAIQRDQLFELLGMNFETAVVSISSMEKDLMDNWEEV
jgi:hypothetical protein